MDASTKVKLKAKLQEVYNWAVISTVVVAIIYYLPVIVPAIEDGLWAMGFLVIVGLLGVAAHKSE